MARHSIRFIAYRLKRSATTISREIARNGRARGYRAVRADKSDFTELLKATDASKGNLGAQIRILEDANYIVVHRTGTGRRSHMAVEISSIGREAFQAHIVYLQSLIKGNEDDT